MTGIDIPAAAPEMDTAPSGIPTHARHQRVAGELERLADAVLPGRLDTSREVAEGLVRIIGLVVRLHEEHQVGPGGRCVSCGRWRRCPVQKALSIYVTPWLAAGHRSEPFSRSGRAADHVRGTGS